MGCFFLLLSCENNKEELDAAFGKKATAIEEALNVESYLSQDGKTKAKLVSPYMLRQVSDSQYIEFPRTLHVDFYDTTGVVETILDAKYGKYREYESKVLLRDSVIVINIKNGDTLRTPELWWDQNKQEFYTDKPSHISKRDGTDIHSKFGMKAKQDLSWYELYGNSGVLPAPDDAAPGSDSLRKDSATPGTTLPLPTPANSQPVKPVTVQPAGQAIAPPSATTPPQAAPRAGSGSPSFLRRTDSMRAERQRRMSTLKPTESDAIKPVKQP